MAVIVNPPLFTNFPQNNPFTRGSPEYAFTQDLINSLRQQQIVIDALWRRTGGNVDVINTVTTSSNTNFDSSILIEDEISSITITDDYTAIGNEYIICNNATSKTVTLPLNPENSQRVSVTRWNGEVTVGGNGRNILNDTTVIINTQFSTLDFVYNLVENIWIIA